MSESDARSQLIEAFKNCLNHSAKGQLDFAGKYVELACHDGDATIIWSLNQKWFLEGELYDYNKSYQQRKVVANFSPGDFLVIPGNLSKELKLYARADQKGSWFYTCLLYTSPSPRDRQKSRMPSSA